MDFWEPAREVRYKESSLSRDFAIMACYTLLDLERKSTKRYIKLKAFCNGVKEVSVGNISDSDSIPSGNLCKLSQLAFTFLGCPILIKQVFDSSADQPLTLLSA